MILKEKTLLELKINIHLLKPSSAIKVYFQCNSCLKEYLKSYRDCKDSSGLCNDCSKIRNGKALGEKFGKTQTLKGKCVNCGSLIRSTLKYCKADSCQKILAKSFSEQRSGENNPAWTGKHVCECGNKKSFGSKQCIKCSFNSGLRSGIYNGRYKKENREYRKLCNKIRKINSSNMSNVCKKIGYIKNYRKTENILGYTWVELKLHLESKFTEGMTWENYGKWHVDHITPIDWFIKNNCFDIKIVNALSNLQPLWAKDNIKKSNKIEV